jgi:hypothetical protein
MREQSMMSSTAVVLRLLGREWWNRTNRLNLSEFLKYSILLGSLTLFVVHGTQLVSIVFNFLLNQPPVGEILIRKMMHMATLAAWLLLILTSVIMGFTVLFLSEDLRYLFSLPVPFHSLFYPKLVRCVWLASWPILILVSPLYLAMGRTVGNGVSAFGMLILAAPGFILSAVLLGVMISLLIAGFFSAGNSRRTVVASFIVLASVVLLLSRLLGLSTLSGQEAIQVVDNMIVTHVGELWFLPPYWLLQTFRTSLDGDTTKAWFFCGILWSTAALALVPLLWLVHETRIYFRGFSRNAEGARRLRTANGMKPRRAIPFLGVMGRNAAGSLLAKDLKFFVRMPSQWMQFSLLVALVVVYLSAARHALIGTQEPFWHNVAVLVNLALTGFVVASLTVRFFYPHLAQEGRATWVIHSSPFSVRRLFWVKFLFGLSVNVLVGQMLTWISLVFLKADAALVTLCAIAGIFLTVALTALAYAFGAIFPTYRTEHPAEIASEMGGLLTFVLSILLVGGGVVVLAWPIQQFLREPLGWSIFRQTWTQISLGLVVASSLLIALPCVAIGPRALARKEP